MAQILQPTNVIRLAHTPKNAYSSWGYKWHLVAVNRRTSKKKPMSACGIVVNGDLDEWESGSFEEVNPKDLCARCFAGLDVKNGRKVFRF